jgi:hypothetical protein
MAQNQLGRTATCPGKDGSTGDLLGRRLDP